MTRGTRVLAWTVASTVAVAAGALLGGVAVIAPLPEIFPREWWPIAIAVGIVGAVFGWFVLGSSRRSWLWWVLVGVMCLTALGVIVWTQILRVPSGWAR